MAGITTHILDVSVGRPAGDVLVELEFENPSSGNGSFAKIAQGRTDDDGRVKSWSTEPEMQAGTYRLRFFVQSYFEARKAESFYPLVEITFAVSNPTEHFHVPLLLSPFGYSTYRGS